jgi:alkylation response protein AidB-like acyl-CoA dehydrogenase
MRNIYELLKAWCDTRVVGGKLLKEHTITAAVLADIVVAIETSRAETCLKARMLDRPDVYGSRHTPEMLARTRVTKLYVSDQLTSVANKAMDLMGSFGYSREGEPGEALARLEDPEPLDGRAGVTTARHRALVFRRAQLLKARPRRLARRSDP